MNQSIECKCPIWGTKATVEIKGERLPYVVVDSLRAGGRYKLIPSEFNLKEDNSDKLAIIDEFKKKLDKYIEVWSHPDKTEYLLFRAILSFFIYRSNKQRKIYEIKCEELEKIREMTYAGGKDKFYKENQILSLSLSIEYFALRLCGIDYFVDKDKPIELFEEEEYIVPYAMAATVTIKYDALYNLVLRLGNEKYLKVREHNQKKECTIEPTDKLSEHYQQLIKSGQIKEKWIDLPLKTENNQKYTKQEGNAAGIEIEKILKSKIKCLKLNTDKMKGKGIKDYAHLLSQREVISKVDLKKLFYLGDIRNLCSHDNDDGKEPTLKDIKYLVENVEEVKRMFENK